MAISIKEKRGWLRDIASTASENGLTLLQQLQKDFKEARARAEAGDIASVSGNGQSTTFANSGLSGQQIREMLSDFIDRHEKAVADLASHTPAVSNPSQTQILTEMLFWLKHSNRFAVDFSATREY